MILGLNSCCSFKFGSLWHLLTNATKVYSKMRQIFNKNCHTVLLQNTIVIKKINRFYWKRQQLLKNYKMLQYSVHVRTQLSTFIFCIYFFYCYWWWIICIHNIIYIYILYIYISYISYIYIIYIYLIYLIYI